MKPEKSRRDWSIPTGSPGTFSGERRTRTINSKAQPGASYTIGVGRAVGLSRVPDAELSKSPELVAKRLEQLKAYKTDLEEKKCSLLELKEQRKTNVNTEEIGSQWEEILAGFRQLTMAVTASSQKEMNAITVDVYEAAADAALLAGNLSYYLSCQTRLLHELYDSSDKNVKYSEYRLQLLAYSIIYFGVTYPDKLAIAQTMRGIDRKEMSSSFMQYAFLVFAARTDHDALKFLSLYHRATLRQRIVMNPVLRMMQGIAISQLVRSYLELSKPWTLSVLQMNTESEFLDLLKKEKPELVSCNSKESSLFIFRQPK